MFIWFIRRVNVFSVHTVDSSSVDSVESSVHSVHINVGSVVSEHSSVDVSVDSVHTLSQH